MAERAAAARPSRAQRTPSTSRRSASCSTSRASPTSSTRRSCAVSTTTRAPSSSSPPTRSVRRAASAAADATTAWSSSSAGPPTPGIGWAAGIERIMLAGDDGGSRGARAPRVELFVALDGRSAQDVRATAFALLGEARSAGLAAQMDLGGRSLKGQLGPRRRARRALRRDRAPTRQTTLRDMQAGNAGADRDRRGRARRAARPPRALRVTALFAVGRCSSTGCACARASSSATSSCSVVAGTGWVALTAVSATTAGPIGKCRGTST